MIVNDATPTSTLLEIKTGDVIENNEFSGIVKSIDIQETDAFMMFLFTLEDHNEITVRKMRQVC